MPLDDVERAIAAQQAANSPDASPLADPEKRAAYIDSERQKAQAVLPVTAPATLTPPAQPTTIEEAKRYLAWIAENALTGALDRHHAEAAVKAICRWIRAEDYARQIREDQEAAGGAQEDGAPPWRMISCATSTPS